MNFEGRHTCIRGKRDIQNELFRSESFLVIAYVLGGEASGPNDIRLA